MTPIELLSTKEIDRETWLEARRKGIGGSDAPAILGLNPYRSAFDVYADKLGLVDPPEENEAMRQGRDLEDYVASRFMEATGKKVRRRNAILQHPEYPFMIANIDRFIIGENAGLECKTTSALTKHKFKQGEYPAAYYVQCMHYMAVTGTEKWYLAVLVLGKEFHVFEILRDEAEIQALIEAERAFWEDHVQAKVPPVPDGSKAAGEILKEMFPGDPDQEEIMVLGSEVDQMIERYNELQAQIKELDKEAERIKQTIQLKLGNCQVGTTLNYVVEWKNLVRNALDTKRLQKEQPEVYKKYLRQTEYRLFKIKEGGRI